MITAKPAARNLPMVHIVDDEESVRKGLSRLMRSVGMPCRLFASAEQFLEEMGPRQKGCILLDVTMPRLTGLQLQEELKKRKIDLPIIVISAHDDADTCVQAHQLGARFFLRKPVDERALFGALHAVLEGDAPRPEFLPPNHPIPDLAPQFDRPPA